MGSIGLAFGWQARHLKGDFCSYAAARLQKEGTFDMKHSQGNFRQSHSGNSSTHPRFVRKLSLPLILLLLAPSLLLAQQSQERILVPANQPSTSATQTGARAVKPELVLQTGITTPAGIIAYSPDGKLLASMSLYGGAIKLWELASGRELFTMNLGGRTAMSLAQHSAFSFSTDSATLVSASAGIVKHWDTRTGRELRSFNLNSQGLDYAILSPDGRFLATFNQTQQALAVWNTETGQELQSIKGDINSTTYFHSAAFSPDGRMLATIEELRGNNGTTKLIVRDLASWRVTQTIKVLEEKAGFAMTTQSSVSNVRFSPDGRTVAAIRTVTLLKQGGAVGIAPRAIGRDSFITLWDAASGRELRTFSMASERREQALGSDTDAINYFSRFVFSPDSKQIASVNEQTVKLSDAASGRDISTLKAHTGEVIAIAYSSDGRQLATASADKTIRIWDTTTAITTGRADVIRTLGNLTMPVASLAFSRDGRALAVSGAEAVNLWDLNAGASQRTVVIPARTLNWIEDYFSNRPTSNFFSADGQFFAASDNAGNVKLWETRTGREVKNFALPNARQLDSGSISTDGKLIALVDKANQPGEGNPLPQSNTTPNAQPQANAPAKAPTIPPPTPIDPKKQQEEDKKREKEARKQMEKAQRDAMKDMMKGKSGNPQIMLPGMDMSQLQKMADAAQKGEIGKVMEMMPQLVGNLPGVAPALTQPTGAIRVLDVTAGNEVRALPAQVNFAKSSTFITFSPDGSKIASATGGRAIKLNDVATGSEFLTLAPDRGMLVSSLAWSPNNRLIASGVMEIKAGLNANSIDLNSSAILFPLKLWDVSSAGGRELFSLNGHTSIVTAVAFSPDNRLLASGSVDASVKLWDTATGQEVLTLAGHTQPINALAFSPDGNYIVSGSEDGSTKLWAAQTGELLATLMSINQGADWLVITPDGLFDGTPAAWSQILWRFSQNITDVAPVEIFFNEFFYPGLLNELYSGKRPKAAKDVSQKERRQPLVTIARGEGQTGANASTRTVKIRLEVSEPATNQTTTTAANPSAMPVGARDVRLFRNGTLVKVWRGDVLQGKKQVSLEASLPIVAGENRLLAYAFNRDNVKSADAVLNVSGDAQLQRKGVAYVLAFGVNRYANEAYNLKYAVADARSFADEVRAQQMKLQNYERVEVIELADQEATKENILLALKRLSNADAALPAGAPATLAKIHTTQPEDAVMIYFAGHGTAQGARFYLVPHDLGYSGQRNQVDARSVQAILSHSISDLELEAAFEGLEAAQLLLVIDACNSGQALEAEEKRRGPMNSKGLAQLAYEKGMYILTAAQSYQAALEAAQLGHGYLTYALIEEGLKKGAADRDTTDGTILTREWFNYATDRVPQMQEKEMGARLLLQQNVAFVEGEEKLKDPAKRSLQRPRVFYRREAESKPLIVAKP
jgi:WD40 repeat protein